MIQLTAGPGPIGHEHTRLDEASTPSVLLHAGHPPRNWTRAELYIPFGLPCIRWSCLMTWEIFAHTVRPSKRGRPRWIVQIMKYLLLTTFPLSNISGYASPSLTFSSKHIRTVRAPATCSPSVFAQPALVLWHMVWPCPHPFITLSLPLHHFPDLLGATQL